MYAPYHNIIEAESYLVLKEELQIGPCSYAGNYSFLSVYSNYNRDDHKNSSRCQQEISCKLLARHR